MRTLTIDMGNFNVDLPHVGIVVEGNKNQQSITLHIKRNASNAYSNFGHRGFLRRIAERVLSRPLRIENFDAKYSNPTYSNVELFFLKNSKSNKII